VEDEGVVNEQKGNAVEGAGDKEGCGAASCLFFRSRYYLRRAMRRASGEGAATPE
jgi:hypothetical protein